MSDNPDTTSRPRGGRTGLLVVKILAVIVYVGGLTTVLGLWLSSGFTSLELNDPRRALVLHQVSRLMVFLVVPALIIALIFGTLLLMRSPQRFLRTRWIQLKLVGLVVMIPCAHLYCRMQFTAMRETTDKLASDEHAARFLLGLIAALVGSLLVVVISRIKPRFGQTHGGAVGVADIASATSSSPPSPTNLAMTPLD